MSYINDALKKAQQDKDDRYSRFAGSIARSPEHPARAKIKWAAGLLGMLAMAAVLTWTAVDHGLFSPLTGKKGPPMQTGSDPPAAAPPAVEPRSAPAMAVPDTRTLYQEALAAQRDGKEAAAEWLYRRVLAVDGRHVEAMNNLGVLYLAQGKQDRALEMFGQAILLKADYAEPHYNLSCLFARRKNTAESLRHLESAIALDRNVIHWAAEDGDLKEITASEAFRKLVEKMKQ